MPAPLAYFITFTTYGTWLHGRDPASVDRNHNIPGTPFLPPNPALEQSRRESLRQDPYFLDEPRRQLVLQTIREVSTHRGWKLWAVHVRTNHVHIVVTAPSQSTRPESVRPESIRAESVSAGINVPTPPKPEKVMTDLKAWASRRLHEAFAEPPDREHWTRHGSTHWLNKQESLHEAIDYVLNKQGAPMAFYDGR